MKVLKRTNENKICFEENELEKAKRFIIDSLENLKCEMQGDVVWFDGLEEYIADIKNATTLEEIAEAWNSNTDTFEDGSRMYVKEI